MLEQVLQTFSGKEYLVKNWLISTLDKVIYFKGTIFRRSTKPLFTSQNRVETAEKILPFFKHASSIVASKISMVMTLFTRGRFIEHKFFSYAMNVLDICRIDKVVLVSD
jgi:hypothetical protein